MAGKFCKYFGLCGGCDIDPGDAEHYESVKLGLIALPLAKRGVAAGHILPLVRLPMGIRRRAGLKVDYGNNVGFFRARSNDVEPIDSCMMLLPEINALIAPIKGLLSSLVKRSNGEIRVTMADNGIDIELDGIGLMPLDLPIVRKFAEERGILRISAGKTPIYERETPMVSSGGIRAALPAGSFLQPSREGERTMRETALAFADGARGPAVDLFSGLGQLAFALAGIGLKVSAYDCDSRATASMNIAAKESGRAVRARDADLFKHPATAEELSKYGLIVLDPPRAGAKRQSLEIAKSSAADVIYASCDPESFAEDARILVRGGYALEKIRPIDQFPGTAHIELVAKFSRPA